MRMTSPNDRSLMSLNVQYSDKKTKGDATKAGGKG